MQFDLPGTEVNKEGKLNFRKWKDNPAADTEVLDFHRFLATQ